MFKKRTLHLGLQHQHTTGFVHPNFHNDKTQKERSGGIPSKCLGSYDFIAFMPSFWQADCAEPCP